MIVGGRTCEEEVIPGGHNHHVVVFGIYLLQEGTRTPARAQDDERLLVRILLVLSTRMPVGVDGVGEPCSRSYGADVGDSPGLLPESGSLPGILS